MPIPATIDGLYEYRIANIVRGIILGRVKPDSIDFLVKDGEELERFLDFNKEELAQALLDDIEIWMGFDELLKQVKG